MNKKYNILFLLPDQHRGDWIPHTQKTLEKKGIQNVPIKMPTLKKLMKNGTTFINAISPSPLCAPARACLAAGKSFKTCEVPDNDYDYNIEIPTFYSALQYAGYSVGGVGKFDLHKKTKWWGLDGWIDDLEKMGFTHGIDNAGKMDAANSGQDSAKDPYMNFLEKHGLREYHCENMRTRKHSIEPTKLPDKMYCDNWIAQNAIDMINQFPPHKPWFIQVNFTGPHAPWDITKKMKARWQNTHFEEPHTFIHKNDVDIQGIRQNYAAMLENIDTQIATILKLLEKKGELKNTLIVYSADHGEMLGDLSRFGKTHPHRSSIGIPLVITIPHRKQILESNALVELQDLAATFLDLADTTLPTMDRSLSLLPLCLAEKDEIRECQTSALKDWTVIKNHTYKAIYKNKTLESLYDIKNDVWEEHNLLNYNKEKAENIAKEVFPFSQK